MAFTLDPFARVVMTMMQRFSGDSTLICVSDGVYDTTTSKVTKVEKSYPVKIITFDYVQKTDGVSTKAGTMVKDGDKQVYMDPKTVAGNSPQVLVPVPRPNIDKVLYKGVPHNVVAVKEMNPTGNRTLFFELFIRQ